MRDLFDELDEAMESLDDGIVRLPGFVRTADLIASVRGVLRTAPLRHMRTPGGQAMSVATSSCGRLGWVSDRRGYRYSPVDPESGRSWPAMPEPMLAVAHEAASRVGFEGFVPDACLINRYVPGARLGLHQDRDERDFGQPIVSVSLGLSATFLIGGVKRGGGTRQVRLHDGDVIVFGGPSRLIHHGVKPLEPGNDPILGNCRINLTFRKAG